MPTSPLSPKEALLQLQEIAPELGKADRRRCDELMTLLQQATEPQLTLSKVLDALYPDAALKDALNNFRQFRGHLKHAASEVNMTFELLVDNFKKNPPEERQAWFGGEVKDPAEEEVAKMLANETHDIHRFQPVASYSTPLQNKVIRYFVSYSHEDEKLATDFLKRLNNHLNFKGYTYQEWWDQRILVGEKWHDEIQKAIEECELGLFLVSAAFLKSEYIVEHELSHFLSSEVEQIDEKKVIPLGLKTFAIDTADLKGLEVFQIYRRIKNSTVSAAKTTTRKSSFRSSLNKFTKGYKRPKKKRKKEKNRPFPHRPTREKKNLA